MALVPSPARLAIAASLLSSFASAGDLNPPSGSISPTMKSLAQVEPRIPIGPDTTPGDNDGTPSEFKITAPGSYYLTGHITGVNGRIAIEITAPDVSLDLSGFSIRPGGGGATATFAIRATDNSADRITIRNGFIVSPQFAAIELLSSEYCRVENVTFTGGENAIAAGAYAVITDCIVNGASNVGIQTFSNSIVERCLVRGGQTGISAAGRTIVRDCYVDGATNGIIGMGDNLITDNQVYSNGGSATSIRLDASGARVEANFIRGGGTGVGGFGTDNLVIRNSFRSVTTPVSLPANNEVAAIIVGPGASFVSDAPWANFSY